MKPGISKERKRKPWSNSSSSGSDDDYHPKKTKKSQASP
jgi:hypothetical protein